MSRWIGDLLVEWRQMLAAAPRDASAPAGHDVSRLPRALDLLRSHIRRAGIVHVVAPAQDPAALAPSRSLEARAAAETAEPSRSSRYSWNFGRRRGSHLVEPPPVRLPRQDTHKAAPNEKDATAIPNRAAKQALGIRLSLADAAAEDAGDDVKHLRAEIARLKEALADLLVENRALKQTIGEALFSGAPEGAGSDDIKREQTRAGR